MNSLSIELSDKQLAAVEADRLTNNSNGSNPDGTQYADSASYLTFVLQAVYQSYANIHGITIDDLT